MFAVAFLLVSACRSRQEEGAAPSALRSEEDKTLYALGLSVGRNLEVYQLTEAELATVQLGITDQALRRKPAVDLRAFAPKVHELARARAAVAAESESDRSKAFLEKEAASPQVQRLDSGLLYSDLAPGAGESPKATDTVTVHYRGTLVDGTEFDSSHKRGQPARFSLAGVIPCWTQGLQKMKPKGKARLVCPPSLAYGDQGAPPRIPGGAALIFEVELLEIAPN
jgi:FKBP-type peptidyl-prolyl cis-trans isomerase FkpA